MPHKPPSSTHITTVRTRIIGPCSRTLVVSLSMVWCFFLFSSVSGRGGGQIFGVFCAPFPEEEISDCYMVRSFEFLR